MGNQSDPQRGFPESERYVFRDRLGAGASGVVFQAFDRVRGVDVALKTLQHVEADAVYRLKKEFRKVSGLGHRHLAAVHELVNADEHWFVAMEFVRGVDFLRYVREIPAQREARLRSALLQLAEGLEALHSAGSLHRDIKPQNVLVDEDGRVVIVDFGLITDLEGSAIGELTVPGSLVGTPQYMAPEQGSSDPLTAAADWYSVGVLLYEALTGVLPFDGHPVDIVLKKLSQTPPIPSTLSSEIPSDLNILAMRLLSTEPKHRPTAAEVIQGLRRGGTRPKRRVSQPFVGRGGELAMLSAAFRDAASGRLVIAQVHGPQGVGKTRLVEHFLARISSEATVFRGTCFEHESVPYKAVDAIVDDMTRHIVGLDAGAQARLIPDDSWALACAFPVVQRLGPPSAGAQRVEDPHEIRRRAFKALRHILQAAAEAGPVILWIDGLEWGDEDSARALNAATSGLVEIPLLIIVSHQSDAPRDLLRRYFPDEPDVRRIVLRPEPALEPQHDMRTALSALEAPANRLLEVLAVAGVPLFADVALAAAGIDATTSASILPPLLDAYIRSTDQGRRLELKDEHIGRQTVDRLSRRTRADAHGRVATAIERLHPDRHHALYRHFRDAAQDDRAAFYAERAAEDARGALAFERAASLYRAALALGSYGAGDKVELLEPLGDVLTSGGRGPEAAEAYLEAAGLRAGLARVNLLRKAAFSLLIAGHFQTGTRHLEDALADLGLRLAETQEDAFKVVVQLRDALDERGLNFETHLGSEIDPEKLLRIDVFASVAMGLMLFDTIRGSEYQMRHVFEALEAGEPTRVARALAVEACYVALSGVSRGDRVEELLQRAHALLKEHRDPAVAMTTEFANGMAALLFGRWRLAHERLVLTRQSIMRNHEHAAWELLATRICMLEALFYEGDVIALRREVPQILRDARARGDRLTELLVTQRGAVGLELLEGRPEAAGRLLERSPSLPRSEREFFFPHVLEMFGRLNLYLYVGQGDRALALLAAAAELLRKSHLAEVQYFRTGALAMRALAYLASSAEGRQKEDTLRRAGADAEALAAEGTEWGLALCLEIQGLISAGRGDTQDAVARLLEAADVFGRAGMALHRAVCLYRASSFDGEARPEISAWFEAQGVAEVAQVVEWLAPIP